MKLSIDDVDCLRYNLTQLEQWLREQRLHDGGALEVIEPIIEATQLLQARKTDADVASICDMCAHLSTPQVRLVPVELYSCDTKMSFSMIGSCACYRKKNCVNSNVLFFHCQIAVIASNVHLT